jgi:hypothetical protein
MPDLGQEGVDIEEVPIVVSLWILGLGRPIAIDVVEDQ